MITLTISNDNVMIIATEEGLQAVYIHRLYKTAKHYIPEKFYHWKQGGKILIKVNSLAELSELMFLFGYYLGLGKIQ